MNSIAFPAGPMFSEAKTRLSAPGMLPEARRHSARNGSLVTVRFVDSSSSTLTAPRLEPLDVA